MKRGNESPRRCPGCGATIDWEHNPFRPFCSKRCRLLDLGNWAAGHYRIPGERVPDDELPGEEATHDEEST